MFDNLLFVFRNNVMFKNIDSQPRMVEPKPAIPDTSLHKFGLAKVSSNSKLIGRLVLRVRLWEEAHLFGSKVSETGVDKN